MRIWRLPRPSDAVARLPCPEAGHVEQLERVVLNLKLQVRLLHQHPAQRNARLSGRSERQRSEGRNVPCQRSRTTRKYSPRLQLHLPRVEAADRPGRGTPRCPVRARWLRLRPGRAPHSARRGPSVASCLWMTMMTMTRSCLWACRRRDDLGDCVSHLVL